MRGPHGSAEETSLFWLSPVEASSLHPITPRIAGTATATPAFHVDFNIAQGLLLVHG
jgi:hypothetical protein